MMKSSTFLLLSILLLLPVHAAAQACDVEWVNNFPADDNPMVKVIPSGNYIYMFGQNYVQIWDNANPAGPFKKGMTPNLVYQCGDGSHVVKDFTIFPNDTVLFEATQCLGIKMFDVGNPAKPSEKASVEANNIKGIGSFVLGNGTRYLVWGGAQGLNYVDCTNPSAPGSISSTSAISRPVEQAFGFKYANKVYLAMMGQMGGGFTLYDVTDFPSTVITKVGPEAGGDIRGQGAFHRNGRIYVLGRSGMTSKYGMYVFSVANGSLLGTYQGGGTANFTSPSGVAVDDLYAYLGLGQCVEARPGMDIVDISDPANMYSVLDPAWRPNGCGKIKPFDFVPATSGNNRYFFIAAGHQEVGTQVDKIICGDFPNVVLNGYSPSAMDPTGNPTTLTITLKNTGTASIASVSAFLSASYTGVTINPTNPQNYGTLAAGQSVSRDFSVTVGTNAAPGSAPFILNVNSGEYSFDFDVSINAPHPNLVRSVTKGAADALLVSYTNTGNANYTGTFQASLTAWTADVTITPPGNVTFGPVVVNATTPTKSYAYASGSTCPAGMDFLSVHMAVTDPTVNNSPPNFNVNLTGTGLHPLILFGSSAITKGDGTYTLTLGLLNSGDASATSTQITELTEDSADLSLSTSLPVNYNNIVKNQTKTAQLIFNAANPVTGNVNFTAHVASSEGCWTVQFVQSFADVQFAYNDEKHCGCPGMGCTGTDLHPPISEGDDNSDACVKFSYLLTNTGSSTANSVTAILEDRDSNPHAYFSQNQAAYSLAAGAQGWNSTWFKLNLTKDYCSGDDTTCPKLRLRLRFPDTGTTINIPDYTIYANTGGEDTCSLSVSGSASIMSDSGNHDGVPNPGEIVEFSIGIKNSGTGSAPGVVGAIGVPSNQSAYVTINSSSANFGTIAAGATASNPTNAYYKFTLTSDAPAGTYNFPLTISSSCLSAPVSKIVPIYIQDSGGETLPLSFQSFTVSDPAPGDGEGDLDKGESVALNVTLRNDSTSSINGRTATLTSSASGVTISSQGSYTAFPGMNGTASFGVTLSSNYASATVPFSVAVQDTTITGKDFSVPVGTSSAVNLTLVDAWVDDADDVWRPGETVTLVVSLQNTSEQPFTGAATTLTPRSSRIVVNSLGTYTASAGATAEVLYSVYIPSDYKSTNASFDIAVDGATAILPAALVSVPVDQQSGAVRALVVPVVAHAGGVQNTNWKSDLVVRNTTDVDMQVTLLLIKSSVENTAPPEASFTVTPGTPLVLLDVLNCVDLPAFQGNTRGSLLIRYSGTFPPAVTSRTYNDLGDRGTYGQSVPAVLVDSSARGTGGSYPSILFGLVKTTSYRSNLGVANIMGVENKIKVTLYDGSGTVIGSPAQAVLAAYNMAQIDDILAAVSGDSNLQSEAFWAKVESESTPPVDFAAYASIVDNKTGDGSFVSDQIHGFSKSLIPGVAHATGANNTVWKTDLNLYNPSSAEATVKLTYFPYGASDGTAFTKSGTIPAHGTQIVNDILTIFSGLNPQEAGFLVAETLGATGEEVLLSSRTYNDQGTKGTYGQYIPSLDLGTDGGREAQKMFIPGLSSNSAFRLNIGMINGDSDGAALAKMTLRSYNGSVLGSKDYYLGLSYSGTQIANDTLLADMGVAVSFENATLEVTVGGDNLFVYASSVDNTTGDPIFLLPEIK